MSDAESDLKATRDDLIADARRLEEIEQEKATLGANDPRLMELSREGEQLTQQMALKARVETQVAQQVRDEGRASK